MKRQSIACLLLLVGLTMGSTTALAQSIPVIRPGDVDGDGKVNAADVEAVVQHLLGHTPEAFCTEAADVDNNGTISVADLVRIISLAKEKKDEDKIGMGGTGSPD